MSSRRPFLRRHPLLTATAAAALAVAVGVALWLFQPWALFIDAEVDEAFPVAGSAPAGSEPPASEPAGSEPAASEPPGSEPAASEPVASADDGGGAPEPRALAGGAFTDRSHPTSGEATVFELDGRRVLRIEELATDNGPDLFVYLSTAPPDAPSGDFDADFVNLGRLKGNLGSQNYDVPADVDLARYRSVVIWCDRFDVVFGAAPLTAA